MTDDNLVTELPPTDEEAKSQTQLRSNDECLPFLIRRRESQKLGHSLTIACSRG